MSVEMMRDFFLWSVAISYAILFIWLLLFMLGRDWIRRFHGRWFRLPEETFDAIHYAGMAVFKIGIMLLALIPFISLCIVMNHA